MPAPSHGITDIAAIAWPRHFVLIRTAGVDTSGNLRTIRPCSRLTDEGTQSAPRHRWSALGRHRTM